MKVNWTPVATPPEEYETVITLHEEDLFPVCAFRLHHGGKDIWLRQIEGPEDISINGKNDQLYRPPTHWMRLSDIL